MNETYTSQSIEETLSIAEEFARHISPGDVVGFYGGLGAGKTAFIKGLCKGLGLKDMDEVRSPTFAIMHVYDAQFPIYHYDLYRLENDREIEAIGFDEFLEDKSAVCCIEWAERAENFLPQISYSIRMESLSENQRKITVTKNV